MFYQLAYINNTIPPFFDAGNASLRNPITSSNSTPCSRLSGVTPICFNISFDGPQAVICTPALIASCKYLSSGGGPGVGFFEAAPFFTISRAPIVQQSL